MDDLLGKVHVMLSRLEKATVYDLKTTKATFDFLNEIFQKHCEDPKAMDEIWEVMIKHNFLYTVVKIWKQINKGDRDESLFRDTKSEQGALYLLVKTLIWNYSDRCYDLCKICYYNSEMILLLLDDLRTFADDLKKLDDHNIRHHIKACFGILHNLLRHCEDNMDHISENDGLKVVTRYANSDFLIIRCYSYIVSAYCTKKNESNSLLPKKEVLKFMLELLDDALTSENHINEKYCLSAAEITEAIDMLSVNESNKKDLIGGRVMRPLLTMLNEEKFSEDEILKSLRCIWTLTLTEHSKKAVLQEAELIDKLKGLNVNGKEAKESRRSLIYTLTPHTESTKKHVMLSYQWDSQKLIAELYNYLVQQGFRVWMDVNEMKGSINDCMAEAVENSAIVLMAVTKKYNESRQTKKEAQYADERNIPLLPVYVEAGYRSHKWLGILMAGRLYVDISVSDPATKFPEIKNQILSLVPELGQSLARQ